MASPGLDAAAVKSLERSLVLLGAGISAKKLGALGIDETLDSFSKLKRANKDSTKLAEKLQGELQGNIKSLMEMRRILSQSINTEEESAESKANVMSKLNSKFLEMGDMGEELKKIISAESVTREDALNIVKNEFNKIRETHKLYRLSIEETIRAQKEFTENRRKSVLMFVAALGTASTRLSGPLREMQNLGFQTEATVGGLTKLTAQSILFGVSQNEATKFTRRFSNQLITLTDKPLLNASHGLEVIAEHGEILRKRFGMIGDQQIQAVGQLLEMTTNLGQRADQLDFEGLADNIQRLSMMTEHSADEIIKKFTELGQDRTFRGLFMSLGEHADMTHFLTESYLELQEATHMSLDEFIRYRRFLAEQRKQTAVERTVQAAFTERLAGMAGTFTDVQMDLLRRGRESYMALEEDERLEFDQLINQLRLQATEMIMEAQRAGDTEMEHLIRTVFDRTNLEDGIDMMTRETAGITDSLSANRETVEEAAKEQANALLEANSYLSQLLSGLQKSVIAGAGVGLIPIITAGIKAAAFFTHGRTIPATGMPGIGRRGPGPLGTRPVGAARGLVGGVAAFTAASSVLRGITTAIETEGTAMTKAFEGGAEALRTLTFGIIDVDKEMMEKYMGGIFGRTLQEDIPDLTIFDKQTEKLQEDTRQAIKLLEEAREAEDQERVELLKTQISRLQELIDQNEENRRETKEQFEKDMRENRLLSKWNIFSNITLGQRGAGRTGIGDQG